MKIKNFLFFLILILVFSPLSIFASITIHKVSTSELEAATQKDYATSSAWKEAAETLINLMAQPMIAPRPAAVTTPELFIKAISDGKSVVFYGRWKDPTLSDDEKLGNPAPDAFAIQFPASAGDLPPIFMGAKGFPVEIAHWTIRSQNDLEKGKKEMKDIYPNMNVDIYPMEFKDAGNLKNLTEEQRRVYSPGKSSGNPQSYRKQTAVDVIWAEGFGSSALQDEHDFHGKGYWTEDGYWHVFIKGPLKPHYTHSSFAVWNNSAGGRKDLSMVWTPLETSGLKK